LLLAQLTDHIGRMAPLRLVSEAAGAVAEKAAEGGHEAVHELPNLITLITHFMADGPAKSFLEHWEGMIFAYAIAGLIILVAHLASRNPQMIPGRLQNVVEMVVESLSNFITGILGPYGRR
jgi:F0F1-type ATP synthase membrane subunit a